VLIDAGGFLFSVGVTCNPAVNNDWLGAYVVAVAAFGFSPY
jgi:hypothetical protein